MEAGTVLGTQRSEAKPFSQANPEYHEEEPSASTQQPVGSCSRLPELSCSQKSHQELWDRWSPTLRGEGQEDFKSIPPHKPGRLYHNTEKQSDASKEHGSMNAKPLPRHGLPASKSKSPPVPHFSFPTFLDRKTLECGFSELRDTLEQQASGF